MDTWNLQYLPFAILILLGLRLILRFLKGILNYIDYAEKKK